MSGRISTFGNSTQISYLVQSMQSQMNRLTGEIASGMNADPTASLGTGAALLYQLQMESNQQTVLQTSITTASNRLDAAQTALTSIGSTAQTLSNAAIEINEPGSGTDNTMGVLGQQAQGALEDVLGQLNTTFAGSSIFGGDDAGQAMQSPDAAGGPLATMQSMLSAAVSAAGGPLTSSDVSNLINGPDGINSVFTNTNSNPALNYAGSFYIGSTDSKPTMVVVGTSQTLQYNASANQPAFQNILEGLSMLSLLNAPSSQLDDTAKSALLSQALTALSTGQSQMTELQGELGAVQSQMTDAVNQQQSAAAATQEQINNYEQADTYNDTSQLNMLQTQIQATYDLTSTISQLSLVHYMPTTL